MYSCVYVHYSCILELCVATCTNKCWCQQWILQRLTSQSLIVPTLIIMIILAIYASPIVFFNGQVVYVCAVVCRVVACLTDLVMHI